MSFRPAAAQLEASKQQIHTIPEGPMSQSTNSGYNSAFPEWLKLPTRAWVGLFFILVMSLAGTSGISRWQAGAS
jgi:hypothetical protein